MTDQEMDQYFIDIEKDVKLAYDIANKARKKGFDPEDAVPIPLAQNMAERVEGLISAISPQILNKGIPKRISELEKEYGAQDWRVAFKIAEELALEKFCKFSSKKESMEMGIRTGFAYITMGVVASPLEGFVELRERKTRDGKIYLAISFAGPIRSAGGTGASVSVLIADYLRKKMGYAPYDPDEKEIKRFSTELYDYHERITNLQYLPTIDEIEFLAKNIPIQIDGEPSEKIDVSNYKDLDRVDTDRIRNGVCLVLGEGIAQKAPKLWKQLSKWGKDFGLDHWNFMEEFIKLQKKVKAKSTTEESKAKITPDYTYIKDLVAGRPVLAHPLCNGGFRLRFGRSRTSGYSAASIHPATMNVLSGYIATGSQLKTERPGKGCTVTPCDSIDGPVVLLNNGDVVQPNNALEAKKISSEIKEILFLGDILFNYGDFFNRAHSLVPAGYCQEHWIQELEKKVVDLFGTIDLDKLSDISDVNKEILSTLLNEPITSKISALNAIKISKSIDMPLHPNHTYFWSALNYDQLLALINFLTTIKLTKEEENITKVLFPFDQNNKRPFELIGIPHKVINNEFILLEKEEASSFCATLDLLNKKPEELKSIVESNKEKTVLEIINMFSQVKIKDKSGVFVGARMGRPEKAKMRKLTGSPHVLFPVGQEGGKLRCFQSALEAGKITGEFAVYRCKSCNNDTVFRICEKCNKPTKRLHYCNVCGLIEKEKCPKHDYTSDYMKKEVNINELFDIFKKKLGLQTYPDLIKGVRGTSNKDHIPEHLVKGILRSKNDVYVNKDGTIRYDMTQLPITHFKPSEIGTSIEKLKQLGYNKDIKGKDLEDPNQILELRPQDIILPACDDSPDEGADKVLFRATKFIDELLSKFYNLKEFYGLISEKDLAGHLVVILAPHTSAGIVGRIIGFSKTQGFLANPMIHAATRRDCDGDEASIMLLLDSLINFSRKFLPASRGSTQDAPLVLTSKLTPSEVDDMVFDLDVAWKYPLEFYNACIEYKKPWDIKVEQLAHRLETDLQYKDFGYTHSTTNINDGVTCSAYKIMPSMEEKLLGQMDLADKIRAADEIDVARLVIERHFLPDIKGNLRKFSMQQFRCVSCNEKYRRPPLSGKCKCGGKIIFTISEGSIIKYLEPSISLAKKYNLPSYLKQTLELTKRRVEDVFGKEKEKQVGLGQWFG